MAAAGRRATGRKKRSQSPRNPWEAGVTAVGTAAAETKVGLAASTGSSGHGKASVHADMGGLEGLQWSSDSDQMVGSLPTETDGSGEGCAGSVGGRWQQRPGVNVLRFRTCFERVKS